MWKIGFTAVFQQIKWIIFLKFIMFLAQLVLQHIITHKMSTKSLFHIRISCTTALLKSTLALWYWWRFTIAWRLTFSGFNQSGEQLNYLTAKKDVILFHKIYTFIINQSPCTKKFIVFKAKIKILNLQQASFPVQFSAAQWECSITHKAHVAMHVIKNRMHIHLHRHKKKCRGMMQENQDDLSQVFCNPQTEFCG